MTTKYRLKNYCTVLVAMLVLVACQQVSPGYTPTPRATNTPHPTATIAPTFTVTPIPPNAITTDNCSKVSEITRVGSGVINQMINSSDGEYLLVASAGGLY
ncbi:MAG: hypothetical protein QM730_19210 [Anaerolineales bacterium]